MKNDLDLMNYIKKIREANPIHQNLYLSPDDTKFIIAHVNELEELEVDASFGDRTQFYYKIKICADKHLIPFALPEDLSEGFTTERNAQLVEAFISRYWIALAILVLVVYLNL